MRRYNNMQLKTLLNYEVSLPIGKLTFKFLYGGLSIL